eukprot:470043_1
MVYSATASPPLLSDDSKCPTSRVQFSTNTRTSPPRCRMRTPFCRSQISTRSTTSTRSYCGTLSDVASPCRFPIGIAGTDLMSFAHTGVSEMINNFVFLAPPPHAPPPRPNVSHPSLSETAHEADEKKNSTYYAQRTFPEIMFLQELDHDHIIRMMNVMKDENDSCVAMSKTDGISRGIGVDNTGADISVPVFPATLGRIMDVLEQPVDEFVPIECDEKWPIHRDPPGIEDLG